VSGSSRENGLDAGSVQYAEGENLRDFGHDVDGTEEDGGSHSGSVVWTAGEPKRSLLIESAKRRGSPAGGGRGLSQRAGMISGQS